MIYLRILIVILFLVAARDLPAQDLTAKEMVQKAHQKVNGESSEGSMTMKIVRPAWTREVSMKFWSLGTDFHMIYITAPAKDKGQVYLKRYNEMWNWMPNINRMIKIPPSMMSQSWMGSDFTNDDLVKMNSIVEDYSHRYLGEETLQGYQCRIVELIPNEDAAVVWGMIKLWITEEEYYELKGEYYDEDMELVNVMTASEIKEMGDRKLPAKLVMEPVNKEGHQTIMITEEMEFNIDIGENFFSRQNMKSIR